MKIELTFLSSKVARRLFLLFVLSALLPIVMLGALSLGQVHNQMSEQISRQLHNQSKSIGVALVERLVVLDAELSLAVARIRDDKVTAGRYTTTNTPGKGFTRLILRYHGQEQIAGESKRDRIPDWLNASDAEHLKAGNALLTNRSHLRDEPELFMSRAIDPANLDKGILIGEIRPDFLWDVPINETTTYCILNQLGRALFCSDVVPSLVLNTVNQNSLGQTAGKLNWERDGEEFLGYYWSLFLEPIFNAASWAVVLGEPKSGLLSASQRFNSLFAPVIVCSILVVTLLSVTQIRRFMGPLEKLRDGTQRIGKGEFDTKVDVTSGDEFEELADSFNDMAGRLGKQFAILATMAEIDRLILSTMDADHIVETLLLRAGEVVHSDMVAVLLVDQRASPDATLHLHWDLPEPGTSRFSIQVEETELEALSLHSNHLLSDVANCPSYLQPMARTGVQGFLVLPIIVSGEVSGAICFGVRQNLAFTTEDIQQARELTDRAAVALSNAAWEEKLYHQAHYDALTDLPNRALLQDRLEQAVSRAKRNNTAVAVMFLDLDRFKSINDSLGHAAGDSLLQDTANRLLSQVREIDTVVRFGGDEFIIILPDLSDDGALITNISRVCEGILAATTTPYVVAGHQVSVTTSIGISLFPRDADNFDDLLKNADSSMYHAKAQGRDNYQFYARELNAATTQHLQLENDLRHAIDNNELVLFYQPQVESKTGKIVGAETLIRWRHPEHGLVSPAKFIPIAEETGVINTIGEWVIRTACAQAKQWLTAGLPPVRLAVNLSARQFRSTDLVSVVERALSESELPVELLELEVTEGTIMTDIDRTIGTLEVLSGLGIRLAVDDFGTGYSSLAYLAQFPIHVLKVDQSFVRDITTNPDVASIVAAIVGLAHSLNLEVIAEGVEDAEQLAFLRSLDCEEIQGYLYSKPLPADDFEKLIMTWDPGITHESDLEQPRLAVR